MNIWNGLGPPENNAGVFMTGAALVGAKQGNLNLSTSGISQVAGSKDGSVALTTTGSVTVT